MATYTTPDDMADYFGGKFFTAEEVMRIRYWLAAAERDLQWRAGGAFHADASRATDGTPMTPAAQDWVLAACIVAEWYWLNEDPEDRKAQALPYDSQRLGDYAYQRSTRKREVWTSSTQLRDILRRNRIAGAYVIGTQFDRAPSGAQSVAETAELGWLP